MIIKAVLVDTGPLFALSAQYDQYNKRAVEELRELANGGYHLTVLYSTISETYSLIQRKSGLAEAVKWLEFANLAYNFINPHKTDYEAAILKISQFSDQEISLFDSLTAVVAQKLNFFVWTFEHHFEIMQSPVWRKGK